MRASKRKPSPREQAMLDAEPARDAQVQICASAWQTLDTCRPLGSRPMPVKGAPPIAVPFAGPIPWTAVEQYARFHGLDREATVLLADVITQLDVERAKREQDDLQRKAPR